MSRGPLHNLSAEIPLELLDADERLRLYGRWAMHRHKKQRCGSAEGDYHVPPNDDDREPREMILGPDAAMVCQRALARVPGRERIVLAILYIPHRLPAAAQMRILGIPPRTSQERHLLGLKLWANWWRILDEDAHLTRSRIRAA